MSNVSSYQSEIDNSFSQFLIGLSMSAKTISNYRSDVKHFIDWTDALLTNAGITTSTTQEFFHAITSECVTSYRDSQVVDHIPTATINRRLSAVRTLFKWALQSGLTDTNPTLALRNSENTKPAKTMTFESLLGAYEQQLKQEGAAEVTIKNYVTDAQGFLQWIVSHPTQN